MWAKVFEYNGVNADVYVFQFLLAVINLIYSTHKIMILWQLRLLAQNLTLYPLPLTHSCGHMSRHNTKQNQAFTNT